MSNTSLTVAWPNADAARHLKHARAVVPVAIHANSLAISKSVMVCPPSAGIATAQSLWHGHRKTLSGIAPGRQHGRQLTRTRPGKRARSGVQKTPKESAQKTQNGVAKTRS